MHLIVLNGFVMSLHQIAMEVYLYEHVHVHTYVHTCTYAHLHVVECVVIKLLITYCSLIDV